MRVISIFGKNKDGEVTEVRVISIFVKNKDGEVTEVRVISIFGKNKDGEVTLQVRKLTTPGLKFKIVSKFHLLGVSH